MVIKPISTLRPKPSTKYFTLRVHLANWWIIVERPAARVKEGALASKNRFRCLASFSFPNKKDSLLIRNTDITMTKRSVLFAIAQTLAIPGQCVGDRRILGTVHR